MAEITKWQSSQVYSILRHNMRNCIDGHAASNKSIVSKLTPENYSLIDRGNTCKEINKYRKDLEKECFKYNRKNIVHALEMVIQCPADCPAEQQEDFFRESFNYVCSTLPMGEKCVFVATVHRDERYYSPDGELLSKNHLHIMYVPAIKDVKHEGYKYKLCADALTKRAKLKALHPGLQAHLDSKGIHATVYQKKETDGKAIGLTAKQLKQLTEATGVSFTKSLTLNDLADIVKENQSLKKEVATLRSELKNQKTKKSSYKFGWEKDKDKEIDL